MDLRPIRADLSSTAVDRLALRSQPRFDHVSTTFIAIHRKFTAHRGSPLSAVNRFSLVFYSVFAFHENMHSSRIHRVFSARPGCDRWAARGV
jgi:hypothetical protein